MNKDIYEIFRACRLCGVGAGYKMPIIQSIIDVDEEEIELKQKIRECLQIEVNLHDRMPPLICELCVDKLQDFYEFRKMCQKTNKKTRMRLGLPLQTAQSTTEPDCILGVTEPINSDSDEAEPLVKHQARKPAPKSMKIKEPEVKIKVSNDRLLGRMHAALARHLVSAGHQSVEEPTIVIHESRSPSPEAERRETRGKRAPSPKRVTRRNKTEDTTLAELQDFEIAKPSPRARPRPGPKSVSRSRERQKDTEKGTANDEIEDNPLLVPRQKRPRDVLIETPPALKKTRLSSEPTKPEKTPKPGPKSSKEVPKPTPPQKPPPKAGPKSRKRETSPALKSEPISVSAPRFKKSESQESNLKSKKSDPVVTPASKSKSKPETPQMAAPKSRKAKRDSLSPAPKSLRHREVSPMASEKASEKAPLLECIVCGAKAKAIQGLTSHLKVHVPAFTPPKMACNACELWFSSNEEANSHHRRHTTMGLAYTCSKCYDDFKTAGDYELHFTRNQCLPTYEVPDVKCEECWKMFPTYKLLEEHRCPGEGGRPGGKCQKCNRTYASLKSLTLHEMRCTAKKKAEPEQEMDSTKGLPPVQVRVVRCDSLLTSHRGNYDVRGLSRKFGLDRNCIYPYLSMGDVKPEAVTTFDHMVAIKDEIKLEYLNKDDDVVHWDSDNDSDDNLSSSNKSVDSLSTISLKTLLSPQCLGKVPKKKRKVESDIESDSVLCVHFHESIRSNIDNIIDNLAKESTNSDSNDSDSILDKNLERKTNSVDLFDSVKNMTDISNSGDVLQTTKINTPDEEMNRMDNDNDRICNISHNSGKTNHSKLETNNQNYANDQSNVYSQNEERNKQDKEENLEGTNASHTMLNENTRPDSPQKYSDDNTATENKDMTSIDDVVCQSSDNSRNSPKNGHIVINKVVNEDESLSIEDKVENIKAQTALKNMDVEQKESPSNSKDINKLLDDVGISEQTIENSPNTSKGEANTKDLLTSDTCKTIEDINVKKVESQSCHETMEKVNEHGDSSYVANGETNESNSFSALNDDTNIKHDSSYANNDKTNENDFSYVKDDARNHSSNTKSSSQIGPADTDFSLSKFNDAKNQNEDTEPNLVDSKDSLITENELFDNENIQSVDKFNINYLDEEEKLLMAELDEQIGENQTESNTVGENKSMIGENSGVVGETSSGIDEDNGVMGETCAAIAENSGVIGETSAAIGKNTDVVVETSAAIENAEFDRNYCPNEGFSEEKSETLDVLIKANDLKSLDLDSISDEEFDFDI